MTHGSKRQHSRATRSYAGVFATFIVICIAVCLFSVQYYQNLHTTIRDESKNYLREVSRRVGKNVDRIIGDNFSALNIMGASLELADGGFDEIKSILKAQKNYCDYDNILLVDQKGRAYDIEERESVFLAFDDAIRSDMLNQKAAMTTNQMVNNQEYMIFAIPLNNIKVEGEEMIALAATYNPDELDQVLSMTSFDDQAYSQIITKSGTLITRSSSPYAMKSGYNIFSTLNTAELDPGYQIERLQDDINNEIEDQISFSFGDVHRYMVYTPLQMETWYLLTFVPFQAVNAKSDMLLRTTMLICGLIVVTFGVLVAALFYVFQGNRRKLEKIAFVDEVTGGNTIQRFYDLARKILDNANGLRWALVYTNIENFKVLNSQMGRKNCDELLKCFYTYSESMMSQQECIGRFAADNFCILLSYTDEKALLKRLTDWGIGAERYIQTLQVSWTMPMTEFGVYFIENAELSFPEMIDRAKLALKNSPQPIASRLRLAFYDDTVRRHLFREKQISDMMEDALSNGEFQLYLQPKYHLPDEKIQGAEALVRWTSSTEGMIYPSEFIPLFEKNGFIIKIDLWIFEEVCRTIRLWLNSGLKPMKISVNCSRVQLKNPNFLLPYCKIADKYGIERNLLEIELTESVVFENLERLTKIIQEIHAAGFGCAMDDFGSGYASLNLIQTIPVDTLKIDGIFFQRRSDSQDRTEAVVGSIIRMAQALSLVTVAEGVEYRDQLEMLKRIGCDYIQGFVFAKPMKISDFENLAFGARCGVEKDNEERTGNSR